jgi:hypothetical protein
MPAEFLIGAALGAAVASTNVRKAVRRSLIYGVGGVLVAYDKLAAGAHAVVQGAREATAATKNGSTAQANGSPATATDTSPPAHPAAPSPTAETPS